MKEIKWYNLDDYGHIVDDNNMIMYPLSCTSGIYVYKFEEDNSNIYIGSTINILQRFRQHRYRARTNSLKKISYNSTLYNFVNIYGWRKFKFGILEYINNSDTNWHDHKKLLLDIEQKYINLYNPKLNINHYAGSMLGYKHKIQKCIIPGKDFTETTLSLKPRINRETLIKLKLHNKDITVFILNTNYTVIREFKRIKLAAEFVGLDRSTVSGYIKNGKLWNNKYYFKLKVNSILDEDSNKFILEDTINHTCKDFSKNCNSKCYKLEVLYNNSVIYKFKSIRQASKELNISAITITNYSINNKLWNNKFKFKIRI